MKPENRISFGIVYIAHIHNESHGINILSINADRAKSEKKTDRKNGNNHSARIDFSIGMELVCCILCSGENRMEFVWTFHVVSIASSITIVVIVITNILFKCLLC